MQLEFVRRNGGTAHLSPQGGQTAAFVRSATAFDATEERR
jgi:hypothetical protein